MTTATADALIIGGGPSGLSTALALCRQRTTSILFNSGPSRNSTKHMHTLPTWDHADPSVFRASARTEIGLRYGDTTKFVDKRVASIKKLAEDKFEAEDEDGKRYGGKRVVLATGVKDVFPDIEGYADCWGLSIYHCLFCHGYEDRNTTGAGVLALGMLSSPQFAIPNASMARNIVGNDGVVTIYTHGQEDVTSALRTPAKAAGFRIKSSKIVKLSHIGPVGGGEDGGSGPNLRIHFEDGSSEDLGFLSHAPAMAPSVEWHKQLDGIEVTPRGDFKVEAPFPETGCKGVFAVGDAGSMIKGVTYAVMAGTMGGVGVVHSLCAGGGH